MPRLAVFMALFWWGPAAWAAGEAKGETTERSQVASADAACADDWSRCSACPGNRRLVDLGAAISDAAGDAAGAAAPRGFCASFPKAVGQAAPATTPAHDGHAELMKVLDAKDTSDKAIQTLAKATGELVLCPLSEDRFNALPEADKQAVYDRGAAFRSLVRVLADKAKQGGQTGDEARKVLKRLADDNSKATLSKYVQAQGKFASERLPK